MNNWETHIGIARYTSYDDYLLRDVGNDWITLYECEGKYVRNIFGQQVVINSKDWDIVLDSEMVSRILKEM